MTQEINDETLAGDRLEGIAEIARFRGEDERRTEYLIQRRIIPFGREGRRIVASRRALREDHERRTRGEPHQKTADRE